MACLTNLFFFFFLSIHERIQYLLNHPLLFLDLIGKIFFFVAFPIVFGAIDDFYQAAAEGQMLASLNSKKKDWSDPPQEERGDVLC